MIVAYQGNLYQAVQASTNQTPTPTSSTYWILTGPASLDDLEDGTIYIKGVAYQSAVVTIQNANFEASATALPPLRDGKRTTVGESPISPAGSNQGHKALP